MTKMVNFFILLLHLGIFGCGQKNNKAVVIDLPPNTRQLNDLFYYDSKKEEYLYKYTISDDNFQLRKLNFDLKKVDSCFIEEKTFQYYGTFGFDANNIYFITQMSGEIYIDVEKKSAYHSDIFFENSYLRVVNDTLKNFGMGCIDDSNVYDNTKVIVGTKVDLTKLKVIKTHDDYNSYFDFFIYDNQMYRHGCAVKDTSIDSQHLKYYYENKQIAKVIRF